MIGRGTVKAAALRLRRSIPGGSVIRELPGGTAFDVVSVVRTDTTEWLLIEQAGELGYVAARFTEWSRTAPTIPQSRPLSPRPPVPDVEPIPERGDVCLDVPGGPGLNSISLYILIAGMMLAGVSLVIVLAF